jgi:hypothetical protein
LKWLSVLENRNIEKAREMQGAGNCSLCFCLCKEEEVSKIPGRIYKLTMLRLRPVDFKY